MVHFSTLQLIRGHNEDAAFPCCATEHVLTRWVLRFSPPADMKDGRGRFVGQGDSLLQALAKLARAAD